MDPVLISSFSAFHDFLGSHHFPSQSLSFQFEKSSLSGASSLSANHSVDQSTINLAILSFFYVSRMALETVGEIIEAKASLQSIESLIFYWRLLGYGKKLEKHYKSCINKSKDCKPSQSVISYISVLQNHLWSLLNRHIPELQRAWFCRVWVMPRNLHFIKIPRLFCCQASLNTLRSSGLKISVKWGDI